MCICLLIWVVLHAGAATLDHRELKFRSRNPFMAWHHMSVSHLSELRLQYMYRLVRYVTLIPICYIVRDQWYNIRSMCVTCAFSVLQ